MCYGDQHTLLVMKTLQNLSCESSTACYSNPVFVSCSIVVSGKLVQNLTRTGFW